MKPQKETKSTLEDIVRIYDDVLPIFEKYSSDATALKVILDSNAVTSAKTTEVDAFFDRFTNPEKEKLEAALMNFIALREGNEELFQDGNDLSDEDIEHIIVSYDSNNKYAFYSLIFVELATVATRIVSTIAFICGLSSAISALTNSMIPSINEIGNAYARCQLIIGGEFSVPQAMAPFSGVYTRMVDGGVATTTGEMYGLAADMVSDLSEKLHQVGTDVTAVVVKTTDPVTGVQTEINVAGLVNEKATDIGLKGEEVGKLRSAETASSNPVIVLTIIIVSATVV